MLCTRAGLLAALLIGGTAVAEIDWTEREKRLLGSLSLSALETPPANPSNRFADDEAAAAFGRQLFFDERFSGDGDISCATCHQPERYFTDGRARSLGAGEAMRNSPTLIGTAYNRWFYWDGRRDSLWAQALIPFEAADEMGSSRVAVLRVVASDEDYRTEYERVFGAPLDIDLESLPAHAGPFGSEEARDAWASLSLEEQQYVNRIYSNLGKAIAAFERTLLPEMTRLDRHADGVLGRAPATETLSEDEVAGARLFFDSEKTQCLQCHNGPLLTNGEFHNIGSGNFSGDYLDFGRDIGLRAVLMDEFNCLGPYSDAEKYQCRELLFLNRDTHLPLRGAFKVPSLRGLRHTAPYFHDGRFETLNEVLGFYNNPPPVALVGPHELQPMALTDAELAQLEAFLLTLSGAQPHYHVAP